jgi:hypothetical protein
MFEEPLDSGNERREIVIDRGLNDGMSGVEVSMRQVNTHPGHVDLHYVRLQGQHIGRNRSHRLADFDETNADCIEHHPVIEGAATQVVTDCRSRGKNVFGPIPGFRESTPRATSSQPAPETPWSGPHAST